MQNNLSLATVSHGALKVIRHATESKRVVDVEGKKGEEERGKKLDLHLIKVEKEHRCNKSKHKGKKASRYWSFWLQYWLYWMSFSFSLSTLPEQRYLPFFLPTVSIELIAFIDHVLGANECTLWPDLHQHKQPTPLWSCKVNIYKWSCGYADLSLKVLAQRALVFLSQTSHRFQTSKGDELQSCSVELALLNYSNCFSLR